MKKIPSYVLNDFLKFDRKIYRLFGMKLGRSISFRTILYFLGFGVLELVLYFMPVIGWPLRSLPFIFLFMIPGVFAYLLGDIGTENRSPISFFRSFFGYQFRKMKKVTYFKGKEVQKPKTYAFSRTLTYKEIEPKVFKEEEGNKIVFQRYLTYRD